MWRDDGGDGDDGAGGTAQAVTGEALRSRCEYMMQVSLIPMVECGVVVDGAVVTQERADAKYVDLTAECIDAGGGKLATYSEGEFADFMGSIRDMSCPDYCAEAKEGCAE